MAGYAISVQGVEGTLPSRAEADPEGTQLEPYALGEGIFVPLLRIVEQAGALVIPNETLDVTEYGFALGEDIYRLAFDEDQAGNPVRLEAFVNGEAQVLPAREVYTAHGELYLPMESVESLTGVRFTLDDDRKLLIAEMPGEEPEQP